MIPFLMGQAVSNVNSGQERAYPSDRGKSSDIAVDDCGREPNLKKEGNYG
jgi:hypothetical protein